MSPEKDAGLREAWSGMSKEMQELLTECGSCGEGSPRGECPKSKRRCGHHCNHVWTHDECDWCGLVFGDDNESILPPGVGRS